MMPPSPPPKAEPATRDTDGGPDLGSVGGGPDVGNPGGGLSPPGAATMPRRGRSCRRPRADDFERGGVKRFIKNTNCDHVRVFPAGRARKITGHDAVRSKPRSPPFVAFVSLAWRSACSASCACLSTSCSAIVTDCALSSSASRRVIGRRAPRASTDPSSRRRVSRLARRSYQTDEPHSCPRRARSRRRAELSRPRIVRRRPLSPVSGRSQQGVIPGLCWVRGAAQDIFLRRGDRRLDTPPSHRKSDAASSPREAAAGLVG